MHCGMRTKGSRQIHTSSSTDTQWEDLYTKWHAWVQSTDTCRAIYIECDIVHAWAEFSMNWMVPTCFVFLFPWPQKLTAYISMCDIYTSTIIWLVHMHLLLMSFVQWFAGVYTIIIIELAPGHDTHKGRNAPITVISVISKMSSIRYWLSKW